MQANSGQRDATAGDVLAIWNDVDPGQEAEYHRWYWEQHVPERLSIPGFLSAYRYHAVEAHPRFFTWYVVREVEVLRSPAYLQRLRNPTDWTKRIMPAFRNMTRCACRVVVDAGRGIGGTVVVARTAARAEAEREALARMMRVAVQSIVGAVKEPDVTRIQMWETDRAISDQRTPEQALRGGPDRMIDCAVVMHCPRLETARAAAKQLQGRLEEAAAGAHLDGPHLYTLMHMLSVAA